ncbi:MAG: septum formation initiator family protein [Syntrophobacteraceae bacterium]
MRSRPTQTNRYQQNVAQPRFTVKGVYIARLLVGLLLALNFVLVYAIVYSSNGLPGYRKQNQQVKELEQKVLKLKIENQKLFEMVQALKASPKAQEKLVRQELGWVRENEIILESADKGSEGGEKPVGPIKPFSLPK